MISDWLRHFGILAPVPTMSVRAANSEMSSSVPDRSCSGRSQLGRPRCTKSRPTMHEVASVELRCKHMRTRANELFQIALSHCQRLIVQPTSQSPHACAIPAAVRYSPSRSGTAKLPCFVIPAHCRRAGSKADFENRVIECCREAISKSNDRHARRPSPSPSPT